MRILFLALYLIITSCSSEPEKIYIGQDSCKHCLMIISDLRFATVLWNDKSKTYKFDSIECAAAFVNNKKLMAKDIKEIRVPDFFKPATQLQHNKAVFVVDSIFRSPMGLHVAAISEFKEKAFFETYNWDKLLVYVDKKWNK